MNKAIKKDEEDKDEQPVATPTDLDAIHEKTILDLEAEGQAANKDDEEEEVKDVKPSEDDEEEDDEGDEAEVKDAIIKDKADKDQEVEAEERKKQEESDAEELKPKDIPKVKVKDYDGNVHEFETIDEIPDDFEPSSYKEYGKAIRDLTNRENEVRADQQRIETAKETKERNDRIDRIQAQWNKEIEALVKQGKIAKDEEEKQDMVNEVYKTMTAEMKEGRSVDSFLQAFEITQYRKSAEDKTKRKEELVKQKKARGGKVMSSGGAAPSGQSGVGGKTFEAPPSGVSLDDVHARVLGSL